MGTLQHVQITRFVIGKKSGVDFYRRTGLLLDASNKRGLRFFSVVDGAIKNTAGGGKAALKILGSIARNLGCSVPVTNSLFCDFYNALSDYSQTNPIEAGSYRLDIAMKLFKAKTPIGE